MRWKVIGTRGRWHVVSHGFEHTTAGYMGRGILIATPHKTRRAARLARNRENALNNVGFVDGGGTVRRYRKIRKDAKFA